MKWRDGWPRVCTEGCYIVGSATPPLFRRAYRRAIRPPTLVADHALIPERPFPAAMEEAVAAYCGLADAGHTRTTTKRRQLLAGQDIHAPAVERQEVVGSC